MFWKSFSVVGEHREQFSSSSENTRNRYRPCQRTFGKDIGAVGENAERIPTGVFSYNNIHAQFCHTSAMSQSRPKFF